MILNFKLIINVVFLIFYLYTILFLASIKITICSNFFDLLTNTYINDFYLNNFYFLWTQFFLLPTLLLFIFFKHKILTLKYANTYNLLIKFLTLVIMLWWINEYYLLNQYVYLFKNTQYFFNNLLANPLNKYHPVLFFTSYIFIYTIFRYNHVLTNFKSFTKIKHIYTSNHYSVYLKNNFFWLLMSVSLYLGSWWALQEGSWGGWWNWDASEVFGLLILTLLLITFHTIQNYTTQIIKLIVILVFIILTSLLYCVLQLSYTLTSHNFGLSLIGYGYVQPIFLLNTALIILLSVYVYINFIRFFTKSILWKNLFRDIYLMFNCRLHTRLSKLHLIFIWGLVVYIYAVSFNPILNNIFWNSFSIEILNKWFSWINIKLISVILLWLYLVKFNLLNNILYLLYSVCNTTYIILILPFLNSQISIVKISHILILLMLTINLYFQYSFISSWEVINTSQNSWFNNYTRFTHRNNIVVETLYLCFTWDTLNTSNIESSTSFVTFFNGINTQFFSLNLTDNLLNQVLYNHTYLYTFKVRMYDSSSLITDLYTFLITLILLKTLYIKPKIVF